MKYFKFLAGLAALFCILLGKPETAFGGPRILLRSSWQTINIGDIGHTPGIIRLLQQYIPEAEIVLWPRGINDGVEEMLRANFPKLKIITKPDEIRQAFADCDFMLHSSGPSLVAQKDLERWWKETGKPYGIYGITLANFGPNGRELLSNARFLYLRDSVSLQYAKDHGVTCPVLEFAPDAAFGVNLRNDAAASAFLKANGLEEGKFLCVIPRWRMTPRWLIYKQQMTPEQEKHAALNESMKEHDHAPLREAIIAVTRQTDKKILICPEDETQIAIGKEMLYDPLPDDVKAKVVWRDKYWLTDEALSTYVKSAGIFGLEMHSPIMALANGTPAIVCRFKEQTSKGFMWKDIGLGDWLFDMDNPEDVAKIVPAALAMAKDPAEAKRKAAKAMEFVHQRQRETMEVLKAALEKH